MNEVSDATVVESHESTVAELGDQVAELTRRLHLLVGMLALVVTGACVAIGLVWATGGGGSGESAASNAEIEALRADLERVEAGAALYASQIDGLQAQLVELSPELDAGIGEAIAGLRDFGESTIAFDVTIDEVIPVDVEFVLQRTVQVPIVTEIPINEQIDTTITVDTPVGGIPIDVSVPVDVIVPIDLVVDIPIDETIPIQQEFPVQLDVPIEIDVAETELKNLTDSLATGLESLRAVISGLAG